MDSSNLEVLSDSRIKVGWTLPIEAGLQEGGVALMAVDPATVEAILAAIGAVASFVDDVQRKQWQDDVSKNLMVVIRNTEAILEDLMRLRVWFDQSQDKHYRETLKHTIASSADSLDVFMASYEPNVALSNGQRTRISQIRDRLENAAFQLAQAGPAGYTGVAAAMVLLAGALRVLKEPRDSSRAAMRKIREYFELWIDPRSNTSVASELARCNTEYIELKKKVDNFPKGGYLGSFTSHRTIRGPDGPMPIDKEDFYHGRIDGNFEQGFVGTIDVISDHPFRAPFPGYGGALNGSEQARDSVNAIASNLSALAAKARGLRTNAAALEVVLQDLQALIAKAKILEGRF